MSKDKKEGLPPGWVQTKLLSLRQKLAQNEDWPEKADTLWIDLNRSAQLSGGDEEDQMLSLVVSEALEGVDITVQYPDFYRKLLADTELRHAFLDALAMLAGDEGDELEPLPPAFSRDLSFLQRAVTPSPPIRQSLPGKWQAVWHLLAEQINQTFFEPLQPVYRSSDLLDESSTVLIRADFSAGGRPYDVILEAASLLDAPEQLQLTLWVTPLTNEPLPAMRASLQWGDHTLTAVPDKYGRAPFRPLALDSLLDETGQIIVSDLHLSLESA